MLAVSATWLQDSVIIAVLVAAWMAFIAACPRRRDPYREDDWR